MSSIVLLKEHEGKKKGATISVPFYVGRNMIEKGIGEYLDQSKPATAAESKPSEAELLRKQNEDLRRQLSEKQQHIDELLATEPAQKPSAETKDKK